MFRDTLGVVPRDAPMLIWNSPIKLELPWFEEMLEQDASPAERLAAMEEMLGEGGHVRCSSNGGNAR